MPASDHLLTGITAHALPARRPLTRPDTQLLQRAFGLTIPPWQPGVARMLAEVHGR